MAESDDMPGEVDFTTPNVARMYDYYLGGKDNYPPDREAARLVLGAAPDVPLAALENREFLKRAMRFLAREQGIDQFVDIGPGLPTQGNVHQLARQHDPGAHVVYVDNDACSGRILGRWFDLGLWHRHDRHPCVSRWPTGCW
jgi:hypothetical protein